MSSDVVDRLIEAIRTYDRNGLEAVCDPDMVRWLSLSEQEVGLDAMLASLDREKAVVASSTLEVRRRIGTAEGAVLLLTVDGTTAGGEPFHIPVCIVATIKGDRVTRIDEYANVDRATSLLKEMYAPQ